MSEKFTCTKCGVPKDRNEFYARKASKNGLTYQCKTCLHEFYQQKKKDNPGYRASIAWWNITNRAENRDGRHACYADIKVEMTKQEFLDWAVPQFKKFMELYPNQTPSIDRINPDLSYNINNIRIISHEENTRRRRGAYTKKSTKVYAARIINYCNKHKININDLIKEINNGLDKQERKERKKWGVSRQLWN